MRSDFSFKYGSRIALVLQQVALKGRVLLLLYLVCIMMYYCIRTIMYGLASYL